MSTLTHFDAQGQAHMVDVGQKSSTRRVAVASGRIEMQPAAQQKRQRHCKKGRCAGCGGNHGCQKDH